jgi:hypothetical protein
MPKIRLRFTLHKRLMLSDGVNPPVEIAKIRLEAGVRIAQFPMAQSAVIDTGAPLSLVSKQLWDLVGIRDHIEWILFPPGVQILSLPTLTIGGRTYAYRLGRLIVQPFDSTGQSLNTVKLMCQLVEDDPIPNRPSLSPKIIIGLKHGLFDKNYLVVKTSNQDGQDESWLTDELPTASASEA